jgi:hypothetical protein
MRNQIDFGNGNAEDFLQNVGRLPAHNDQAIGQCSDFFHYRSLIGIRLAKNRVQGCNHGHLQATQKFQDVAAGRSAENSVLMLQANQVNIAEIQEIRGLAIGSQFILRKFEANSGRIAVTFRSIVDRQREKLGGAVFGVNGVAQIGCEGSDATAPGQVVADNCDPAG